MAVVEKTMNRLDDEQKAAQVNNSLKPLKMSSTLPTNLIAALIPPH